LKQLQKTYPENSSNISFNRMHHQAQDCEDTVRNFLAETSKFHSVLGTAAAKGWHRGSARKTQWALSSPVPKFREHLANQLSLLEQDIAAIELFVQSRVFLQMWI
jgi:hypothetical protein